MKPEKKKVKSQFNPLRTTNSHFTHVILLIYRLSGWQSPKDFGLVLFVVVPLIYGKSLKLRDRQRNTTRHKVRLE